MAKKPAKRPSEGDMVRIVFLDHAENSKNSLKFEALGRVSAVTSTAYIVRCWGYVDEIDRVADGNPDNETSYAIVKKAIESIEILK